MLRREASLTGDFTGRARVRRPKKPDSLKSLMRFLPEPLHSPVHLVHIARREPRSLERVPALKMEESARAIVARDAVRCGEFPFALEGV